MKEKYDLPKARDRRFQSCEIGGYNLRGKSEIKRGYGLRRAAENCLRTCGGTTYGRGRRAVTGV